MIGKFELFNARDSFAKVKRHENLFTRGMPAKLDINRLINRRLWEWVFTFLKNHSILPHLMNMLLKLYYEYIGIHFVNVVGNVIESCL